MIEIDENERIGEEDRIVEEGLGGHQTEPDDGPLAISAQQRGGHFAKRRVGAAA